jgi:hypothetical protein
MKCKRLSFLLLLVSCLLCGAIFGCSRKVVRVKPVVNRPTFAYREEKPDVFLIWLKPGGNDAVVQEELGCKASYICALQPAGTVLVIQRTRK